MKRYCLMDCSSEKFNDGEVDIWEINFERVVSECKSKKVTQISEDVQLRAKLDGIYGSHYSKDSSLLEENNFELCNRLEQIITSQFCELDIYNELYLILQYANGEKEKLFLDKWYLDKKSEKNTIPEFQKIKDNIKNLKKKDKENHIFSMEKYSTAKNAEIYSIGCNVVRIWLFSKKFRNLFIKTETRFEKYKKEGIEKIFEDCNELQLDYKTDDYIILEKLLGLNTDTYIRNFILSSIKEPNFEMLSPLIEVLMKCRGCFSRCMFIQCIGIQLWVDRQKGSLNQKERLEVYTEILNHKIRDYEEWYRQIAEKILDELMKRYSYSESKKYVEEHQKKLVEEIKIISEVEQIYRKDVSTYQKAERQQKEDIKFAEKIQSLKSIEQIVEALQYRRQKEIFPVPRFFYFLDSIVTKRTYIGCDDEITQKIQALIINSSYEMYNNQIDDMR